MRRPARRSEGGSACPLARRARPLVPLALAWLIVLTLFAAPVDAAVTADGEALRRQLGADARAERPRLRLLRSRRLGHAGRWRLRALAPTTRLRHPGSRSCRRTRNRARSSGHCPSRCRGSRWARGFRGVRAPGRSGELVGPKTIRLLPEHFYRAATDRRGPGQPALSVHLRSAEPVHSGTVWGIDEDWARDPMGGATTDGLAFRAPRQQLHDPCAVDPAWASRSGSRPGRQSEIASRRGSR